MKGRLLKKAAALALAAVLVSGGVPAQPIADMAREFSVTASAAEYTQNPTTKDELVPLASSGTVSEAHVVKYANKEWYVIGYDGVGLASESGTMTLFLKGTLGKRSFSDNGSNVYSNSSIHSYLESYLADTENFTSDESGAVVARTLSGGGSTGNSYSGHVSGDSVDAKLWLLSAAEARKIPQSIIKSGGDGNGWWLRSPGNSSSKANYILVSPPDMNDYPKESGADVLYDKYIRPAMLLNLNSVIYSSETNTLIAQEAESHSITVSLDNDQGSVEAPPRADKGETVSFTIATAVGYEVETVKFNDTPLSPLNGVYSFTMPDNDVTISVTFNQIYKVEDHIEQDGDTYTIKTAKGWEVFCDCVKSSAYNGFWNKTVKLGLDITDGVTVSAGIPGKPFFGTFDGDGHTLAVALNSTDEEWVAPFSFFNGSIKNLTVTGTIAGSTYAAGLTGFTYGGSIENVTVSADVSGSSKTGGITGYCDFGSLLVKDTVFNGTLQCNKDVCGLIGWASENVGYNQAITIENCLFNGTYTCDGEFHPITLRNSNSQFAYKDNGAYYTVDPNLSNNNYIIRAGTRVSTITVDDDFTITANPTFTFNSVDYYAEGTTITLSRVGSVTGVSVNNGSVEVTDNQDGTYSFTMPAEDVSINGHFSINIDSTIHHGSVTVTVGTTENAVAANEGDTVTLTVTPDKNYVLGSLTVKDSSNNVIEVNNNQFTMPASDVTVSATFTPDSAHFSQSGDTYTIHDAAGWDIFCDCLQDNDTYNRFSGKIVVLGDNISVSRMAGSDDHEFCGTFDGSNKKLTFNATAADNYLAPFRNVKGSSTTDHAVIRNLNVETNITAEDYRHMSGLIAVVTGYVDVEKCNVTANISSIVGTNNPSDLYPSGIVSQVGSSSELTVSGCTVDGTIATDGKYAAGIIGIVQGKATIENSVSSVTIDSSVNGDGSHGGFVGVTNKDTTLIVRGCVFNGKLHGSNTDRCGGFVGWRGGGAEIHNSIFDPAEVKVKKDGSATFARNKIDTYNSYYTYLLNDGTKYAPYLDDGTVTPKKYNNGQQGYTITAGDNVTLALNGTATEYDVSGITAYANNSGLKYGDTIYAGNGDSVSLTLDHTTPTGYSTAFTASVGTLENGVLTMPDSDVVISANDTINKYNITLPEKMEITNGVTLTDGKADYGTQIKFKVKDGYTASNVKANGTELTAEDGVYTVTIPDDDVTVTADITFADNVGARLEGYSLSIQEDGDIGVNFYMSLDDSILGNENAKMHFVIPINSKTGETKTLDMDIPAPTVFGGKNYYVFKCPVAAKEMTATITAQMYVDGVATGREYTYTVRDYAEYLISNAYEADGTTVKNQEYVNALPLVQAMLHYGASAQTLFNNNASDLADKSIANTDYDNPTDTIKNLIDGAGLTNLNETSVGENLTFDGASLNLGSKTAYTLYYKKESGYNLTTPPEITCTGHEVKVVETAAEIRYVIQNISAGELLDNIKVTIGTTELTVNPATYFYAALTAENTAEYDYGNLKAAVTALYYFNEAAKSYKGVQ